MARINLKNCTLTIRDGKENATHTAGLVNNSGGYAAGIDVIAIDGITGALAVGTRIEFAGHTQSYYILAKTETSGDTTSITIDPKLVSAVINDEVINIMDSNTVEVTIGDGNLTYSEQYNYEYHLNRGRLDDVTAGDEAPMEVSFDFVWEYLSGDNSTGAVPTIEEALKNTGNASGWVTSDREDVCRPYAVDLELLYTPPCGSGDKELYIFPDFRPERFDHDLSGQSVTCSGKCNAQQPSVIRYA